MPTPKLKMEESYLLDALHDQSIHPHTREIYLHGHHDGDADEGGESGVDWRMGSSFLKNMHYLERQSTDPILINMWTCGGEWTDGIAIHNVVAASECHIVIFAYRAARSMSSVIFQAADRRVLMPDAGMMLHYGHNFFSGTGLEAETEARINKVLNARMLEIYAEKMMESDKHSGKSQKVIVNYIKRQLKEYSDWWLTSEQAVEEGLADGIFGREGFGSIDAIRKF
jgi:ATP-dependent protease ClpP protease subunit